MLYVHYDGWSRCYDEYIPADSERISPLSLYTSRTDIPKYTQHHGPDDRVYGNVVEGGDANHEAENDDNNDNNEINAPEVTNNRNNEETNVSSENQEESREAWNNNSNLLITQTQPNQTSGTHTTSLSQSRESLGSRISNMRPPTRPSSQRSQLQSYMQNLTLDSIPSINRLLNLPAQSMFSSRRVSLRGLNSNSRP